MKNRMRPVFSVVLVTVLLAATATYTSASSITFSNTKFVIQWNDLDSFGGGACSVMSRWRAFSTADH